MCASLADAGRALSEERFDWGRDFSEPRRTSGKCGFLMSRARIDWRPDSVWGDDSSLASEDHLSVEKMRRSIGVLVAVALGLLVGLIGWRALDAGRFWPRLACGRRGSVGDPRRCPEKLRTRRHGDFSGSAGLRSKRPPSRKVNPAEARRGSRLPTPGWRRLSD